LLPPRENDRDISHYQQLDGKETLESVNGLPPTNNHRKSYLKAMNEIDECSELDYCDTISSVSNYDTLSTITLSSSHSATLRQHHNELEARQDGSRFRSTTNVKVDPCVGWPSRDITHSFKSTQDDSDSEPYITTDKVQKVLENQVRQVFGRTSSRSEGLQSVAASETCSVRSGDYLDSLSLVSHKDSGYRSSEDQHATASMQNSPTLSTFSASTSTLLLKGGSAINGPRCNGPEGSSYQRVIDVKSMCSSLESLSSIRTGLSLPVSYERLVSAHRDSVETTSGRLNDKEPTVKPVNYSVPFTYGQPTMQNTEHTVKPVNYSVPFTYGQPTMQNTEHTVKPVNYGVPFTYGQPTMQMLENRVEQEASDKNSGNRSTAEHLTRRTNTLISSPSVVKTDSGHVINGGQLANEPSNIHVHRTAVQSHDSAQMDRGNSSNYPIVSQAVVFEQLMSQPSSHQTVKYDQSERSTPVVKHSVVKQLLSTPDSRQGNSQKTAKLQQFERPAQEVSQATSYRAPNCDLFERPAQDTKQVSQPVKSDMFQRPAQVKNYRDQDVRQGNYYLAQDLHQGNNYMAQDLRHVYNYPAQGLKQGNHQSVEEYQAARYEQYQRPVEGPSYQVAKYEPPRRQRQGSTQENHCSTPKSDVLERSGNVGPVLLARLMPEPVTVGRQCDRAEAELKPPIGHVSHAMNRVVRVPEADMRSTLGINAVPSYPYQGNPEMAQRCESKKEVSSADSESVFVKGRRCVTPVGSSRVAISRPPPSTISHDTSSRQDTAKGRPSRGVPAAMASRTSGLKSKAKSVSNLSSKPAWKN